MRFSALFSLAAAVVAMPACGGDSGPGIVPTRLIFVAQPTAVLYGAVLIPAVKVALVDGDGTVATGSDPAVTLAIGTNPSAGTLGGSVTIIPVGGVATFPDLSIDRPGVGYTLTANSPGLAPATSVGFDVRLPPVPTALVFTVQPSDAVAGVAIAPAIRVVVEDQYGAPVTTSAANVTVALNHNATGGTLSGTLTVTAEAGVVTFSDLAIDAPGLYDLTVTSPGLNGSTSAPFSILVTGSRPEAPPR